MRKGFDEEHMSRVSKQNRIFDLIDFERINILLEWFNKATGFVTAILDLEGNILSKSGWRRICTEFHRVHPKAARRCVESDTVLAGQMAVGEKYHAYKCHNGLIDVAVPIYIKNTHVANLFSGQFFFEKPDRDYFVHQAKKYKFDPAEYLDALDEVPVVSEEKAKTVMNFLLNMTHLINDMCLQKLEQNDLYFALRESEEKLHLALESAIADNWEINLQKGSMTYNDQWARRLGYEPQEIPPTIKGLHDIMHPDDILKSKEALKAYLDGRKPIFEAEIRIRKKDGTYVWLLMRGKIVERDKKGKPIRLIGTNVDLTKRKHAELALKQSEENLRRAQSVAKIGSWRFDLNTNMASLSQESYRLYGLEEGKEYSISELQRIPLPGYRNMLDEAMRKLVDDRENYDVEFEIQRPNDQRLLDIHSVAEYDGEANAVIGTIQDISERKQREKEKKESEYRFRLLIENLPQRVFSKDRRHRFLTCNEKFAADLGLTPKDVLGKTDFDFFPRNLAAKFRKDDQRIMKTGRMEEYDEEYVLHDQIRIVHTVKTPMYNDNGIIGVMGIFWDITEKKRAEDRINKLTYLLHETGKTAKIGGWEFDAITGEGTWTEEVARIHDLDPEMPINMEKGTRFYTEKSRKKIQEAIGNVIDKAQPYDLELEMITAKGVHKWVRTIGNPVMKGGKVIHVRGSFQDITEMKEAADGLKKYKEHLEELVEEQTRELKEKLAELERFHDATVEREFRMKELRDEIDLLRNKYE